MSSVIVDTIILAYIAKIVNRFYSSTNNYYSSQIMTKLEYLDDTYQFQSEAKVIEIKTTEKGIAVILDKTIFYPQGGGQPADNGKIVSDNAIFTVTDVRMDETGTVLHFGKFENGNFNNGDSVKLAIDIDRRKLNARLHSAGHLIDVAAAKTGLNWLKATKGYHFSDGPYVEYEGVIENPESYIPIVEKAANDLVEENMNVEIKEFSPEETKAKGLYAPEGKSARTVNFHGHEEIGCGGTHVKNSSEIGKITIRKISSKKGNTRIAYSLS
jgi:Ser-tRNA(Ala) deacylase AlaX